MGFSEDRAQGRFGPRYLLTAENPYLIWDAVEEWKRYWRRNGPVALDVFRAPRIDYDRLLDVGATIPMFSEDRMVIIHEAGKVPQTQHEKLVSILERFGGSTKVLLTATEIDRRRKLYRFLTEWAVVEEFPRVYPNKLPGWVVRIAGDFGWTISNSAADLLANSCGDDLFAMRQTIEQITLFVQPQRWIEVADVEMALAGSGHHSILLLLEAICKSDLRQSLEIVRSLFAGEDQPEVWLSALGSLLTNLLRVSELKNSPDSEIIRLTGIKPFVLPGIKEQARALQPKGIMAGIYTCFETDWAIKTSRLTPRMGWELLAFRMCRRGTCLEQPLFDLESAI